MWLQDMAGNEVTLSPLNGKRVQKALSAVSVVVSVEWLEQIGQEVEANLSDYRESETGESDPTALAEWILGQDDTIAEGDADEIAYAVLYGMGWI